MKERKKKIIAPLIVTAVIVLYFIVYFGYFITLLDGIWKYVLAVIPFVLSALMIRVCIERIREIRKGEEDDIGKY